MNVKKLIGLVIAILIIIVSVTAYINKKDIEDKLTLQREATFIIKNEGKEITRYNMEEIRSLGEEEFNANLNKDGKEPIAYSYTGVLLKKLFKEKGIKLKDKSTVIVRATDGYTVAIPIKKVLQEGNVYIAYMKEGKPIGTREEGGKGPYQIIISKDKFSQHWCKYALEAEVK
ncbi:MAG: hypothetical protein FH753_17875 [Firmicutes bacterium]|nr:hypothetical protein [Bacillota bacterium]